MDGQDASEGYLGFDNHFSRKIDLWCLGLFFIEFYEEQDECINGVYNPPKKYISMSKVCISL